MSGAASGRDLQCSYDTWADLPFWPTNTMYCKAANADFSAKFEKERHSFTGSASEKSKTTTFAIGKYQKVDFIPLEIVDVFPNLHAIVIMGCKLRILKAGLFRAELNRIEYLWLDRNDIEVIEPKAFEHLTKLKYIGLDENKIRTLSYKFFENNPRLFYISLGSNEIDSVHPNFFDGLAELQWVDFEGNVCTNEIFTCETCQITQEELNSDLQKCYANCKEGTICYDSYLDPKVLQIVEEVAEEEADSGCQNLENGALSIILPSLFLIASCFLLN
jgi:hypothetical protein